MKIVKRLLNDVLLLREELKCDEVSTFSTFTFRDLQIFGVEAHFVQDNQSRSAASVIRGLHYQIQHPQGKLIRVLSGKIYDVAVDLRRSSTTYCKHAAIEIEADGGGTFLWIPPGFAHGFLTIDVSAEISYSVTDYRYPEYERTLLWSDPTLRIEWPLEQRQPTLSQKDQNGALLSVLEHYS